MVLPAAARLLGSLLLKPDLLPLSLGSKLLRCVGRAAARYCRRGFGLRTRLTGLHNQPHLALGRVHLDFLLANRHFLASRLLWSGL